MAQRLGLQDLEPKVLELFDLRETVRREAINGRVLCEISEEELAGACHVYICLRPFRSLRASLQSHLWRAESLDEGLLAMS